MRYSDASSHCLPVATLPAWMSGMGRDIGIRRSGAGTSDRGRKGGERRMGGSEQRKWKKVLNGLDTSTTVCPPQRNTTVNTTGGRYTSSRGITTEKASRKHFVYTKVSCFAVSTKLLPQKSDDRVPSVIYTSSKELFRSAELSVVTSDLPCLKPSSLSVRPFPLGGAIRRSLYILFAMLMIRSGIDPANHSTGYRPSTRLPRTIIGQRRPLYLDLHLLGQGFVGFVWYEEVETCVWL